MELFEKIKSIYCKNIASPRNLKFGLFVATSILSVFLLWNRGETRAQSSGKALAFEGVDSYIPRGYVLVPIEVQNREALESVFGEKGIVDLFTTNGARGRKLAKHVRMIRAPLNPTQFAVLVPEDQSADLVRYNGAFFVMLQNPNRKGTEVLSERIVPSRKILVENLGGSP